MNVYGEVCTAALEDVYKHRLRARVEFRGDAQFQLGDLLPPAIASYRSLLKEGKSAAQSWAQSEVFDALDAREKDCSCRAAIDR